LLPEVGLVAVGGVGRRSRRAGPSAMAGMSVWRSLVVLRSR